MPNNYPPESRQQMAALVRAGRSEELAKEFKPSAQSIPVPGGVRPTLMTAVAMMA